MAAKYPQTFDVDRETFEGLETWLQAEKDRRIAEWREAGSPDEWHCDLWPLYVGPHFGLMFKGVEICCSEFAV
jgi:hypothetical protein